MSLITLQDVDFDFGREPVLTGASLSILAGERYALIGENGAGKSTLLSILSGDLAPHDGERTVTGGVLIRRLFQETTLDPETVRGATLLETVAQEAFAEERALEAELDRLAAALHGADPAETKRLSEEQGRLQDLFERRDGYGWRARLEAALSGLGVPPGLWERSPAELSGGERRRAALAAALLAGADVLLLDEPTTHLDLAACEWLEQRLARHPAALVVVSHDRWFLDRIATKTIHLARARLSTWSGNYTFWLEASAERRRREGAEWRRQQERVAKTEDFIRRNIAGQKTKQAQSRRKQLEREERIERPDAGPRGYRIDLRPERDSGGMVLEARNLSHGHGGAPLFADFSLIVARGERLGIVGPNGCGKTTLLNVLAGRLGPERGEVIWGHNVDLGLHDQLLRTVSDDRTVIEELSSVWRDATLGELRSFAAAFGFGADQYDRAVGRLSGGERARLALMRLIREGHNTLLLDEPTNHLDMQAREALEIALQDFTGTLLVVSHDRRFLDAVVAKLIVFEPGEATPRLHVGGWSDWVGRREELRQRQQAAATAVAKASPTPSRPAREGLSKNELRRREEQIAALEAEVDALETEKSGLLDRLGDPGLSNTERMDASRRIVVLESELAAKVAQWEAWADEIS